jgi:hypothetical protein
MFGQAVKHRHGWRETLLVATSVLVSLVILEVGCRLYFGVRLLDPRNFASEKIYSTSLATEGVYHPLLGWTFPRNAAVNPLGLVQRLPDAREPRPGETVLVVGDSFVTGYATEERWSTQLENLLNVAALNGAAGGWGIDQTYLRAKDLVPRLRPDVLIFGFIADDMRRAELSVFTGNPKPYFSIERGELVLKGTPVPPYEPSTEHIGVWRKVLGHSLALHRIAIALGLQHRWLAGALELRYPPDHADGAAIGCLIARELRAMKESRAVRDVILFPQYSYTDIWPEGGQIASVEKLRKFLSCAAAESLTIADPRNLLVDRVESHPGGRLAAFRT